MKSKKVLGKLCLSLLFACLTFLLSVPWVSAAQYEGSTQVTARIETSSQTAPEEPDAGSTSVPEEDNVSTGDRAMISMVISLLCFGASAAAMAVLCSKKPKRQNETTQPKL